ncbi:glycoside hydrolase family 3 protein [Xylariaceae sp. FL0255]|nr:glycoside hydrolase family 3 protein [Xylariaceae sp. FL0255]
MHTSTFAALLAAAASGVSAVFKLQSGPLAYSPPEYPSPWARPSVVGWDTAYEKAREFVSQMTLPEKVNLTTGVSWEGGLCVGNTGSVPRLGLRSLCMQDSPLGVRFADYVSAFPSGHTVAASFDRTLMYARGQAMGAEHKGKGSNVQLGPVAGPLGRVPEGGRGWEGFSPDPYLTGVAMAETIQGIQSSGVIACAKHFIGNEQEHFRQTGSGFNISASISSNIDDKTMHELYLWPFSDAVRAGVGAVMCSYNQVNNSYACQNSKMLNGILKGELGFQGFVMSDWSAQHSGVSAALAGLDMTMPGDTGFDTGLSFWGSNLTIAVLNGTIPQYRVDDMAMRIMAAFFKSGQTVEDLEPINFSSWTTDDYGFLYDFAEDGYQQVNWHVDVQAGHGELIREIAAKSTVLLKNDGALPLNRPKFLAVIGEDAGPSPLGPNSCPDGQGDHGCDNGTLAMGWGSGTANFPYLSTPLDALNQKAISDGTRLEWVLDNYATSTIQDLADQDGAAALVFVNADSGEGYIDVDGNVGDRKNLTLWGNGDELIKTVSSVCNNTIVVIHSVGAVLVTDWYDSPNVTAIVWAALPGEQSGNSIVDVLYGAVNPAARTPFTWAANRGDYGVDVLYEPNNGNGAPQQDFTEGVFIDYRHFDKANITPIYEFGFGLSYTSFSYSNIQVKKIAAAPYTPTTGKTAKAPTFGTVDKNIADYAFPSTIRRIKAYLYPYLNTTSSLKAASGDPDYGESNFLPQGATDSDAQDLLPSGPSLTSEPGGNSGLFDELYEVTALVTNTGKITGDEVAQLYVSLGGPDDPKVVLRGFDRLTIQPGQTETFTSILTRRDISNWDVTSQNWIVSSYPKTVYIGPSSRNLPLTQQLD